MKARSVKTEFIKDPIGIDITTPFLSWECEGEGKQTAYEIRAVYKGRYFWSSGKVVSGQKHCIMGKKAAARQRICWQVRLWDDKDEVGEWSETAIYEIGLLHPQLQFRARWINPEPVCDPEAHKPASYLRRSFTVKDLADKPARLYITAHGLYEAWINGKRVGDFVLTPGSYTYDKRLAYQTYDVTALLQEGENEIDVILGDGWYRSVSGVDGDRNLYGNDVALLCQLELDGEIVCMSDAMWEASQEGPLRENDMQQGEIYDAGRIPGEYHPVKEILKEEGSFDKTHLLCSNAVPIAEMERFQGKLMTTPNGETVLDFSQNLAGYVEFEIEAEEGTVITLTHGETLDEKGNFTQENFQDRKRHKEGGTRQQVIYTCKEGHNHYKTRFSIWGFRYAKLEVQGKADLSTARFTAIAVYSKMEQLVDFHCANEKINQLVHNSIWSMKSNFCDVPTDCPTRERAAWTGDMGIFIETALEMMDCYTVVRKWLAECRVSQLPDGKVANIAPRNNKPSFFSGLLAGSTGWGDACIIVPYAMYKKYDDIRILEENYEMMQKWYEYLITRAKALPMNPVKRIKGSVGAKRNPYRRFTIETGIDYGEWCEPDVDSTNAMRTPQSKVATAYFARSGQLLSEIADILGKKADALHYRKCADGARKAFRHIALTDGRIVTDRQAELVRAITFGLLEPEEEKQAASDLNDLVIRSNYHLNTGFLSTPSLCPVLEQFGYMDTAIKLLLQEKAPGWLYSVNKGATTIWESWNGIDENGVPHESLNHYSKGAVCKWIFDLQRRGCEF